MICVHKRQCMCVLNYRYYLNDLVNLCHYSGDHNDREQPLMAQEHAVSLKLSVFWTFQLDVWFVQAEA